MLRVYCEGTPAEIGFQHGQIAAKQIDGSIQFYSKFFKQYTGNEWEDILPIASQFEVQIRQKWPRFFEEMEGIAKGSGRDVLDIVALNVRTEIAFGLLSEEFRSDGCTSLAWRTENNSFLCQNWDWMVEQQGSLIYMTISSADRPKIKMVTEAGIIGKIGLNSAGVGVCLNAVRCRGYDVSHLPVHLGLRTVLESESASSAAAQLEAIGMAGSAHILVADNKEAFGLEFTSRTFKRLEVNSSGQVLHTNHLIQVHEGSDELPEADSFHRLARLKALTTANSDGTENLPSWSRLESILDDHEGFPESICRAQKGASLDATLFCIVMDVSRKRAKLMLGKPCQIEEEILLEFP